MEDYARKTGFCQNAGDKTTMTRFNGEKSLFAL
jgi:hypothetical protein